MSLVTYIMRFVEIIVLMIGWYTFRNLPKPFQIFVYYISFSAISALTSRLCGFLFGNNYAFFHFYVPLELFIIIVGILLAINIKSYKRVAIFILIPYLTFWAISKFTFESFDQLGNVTMSVANTIIFLLAVYGILKITLSSFGSIWQDPKIITLIGILLYFGGNVFVFALSNLIFFQGNEDAISLWKIHNTLHICLDIAFAYSFYLYEWKPDKINA